MFTVRTGLPPAVEALLDPATHGAPPAELRLIQTHLSYVVIAGALVYKVKKAIDVGFADFRSLEVRREMCEREVALNRRLAPDVYLGVVPISRTDGRVHLGPGDGVLDYAVMMRRLDERDSLAFRVRAATATADDLRRVAARLSAFHAATARTAEADTFGHRAVVLYNHLENVRQIRRFVGKTVTAGDLRQIRSSLARFLRSNRALFAERIRAGRVRDCHGDVRAEHVFVDDGIIIVDCIEFADRFRYGDVAGEVAFLVVDLEALGRPDLGHTFAGAYVECSGDRQLLDLLDFYAAYRATVRGKVLSIRSDQGEVATGERAEACWSARAMFALAARHAAALSR